MIVAALFLLSSLSWGKSVVLPKVVETGSFMEDLKNAGIDAVSVTCSKGICTAEVPTGASESQVKNLAMAHKKESLRERRGRKVLEAIKVLPDSPEATAIKALAEYLGINP